MAGNFSYMFLWMDDFIQQVRFATRKEYNRYNKNLNQKEQ